MENAKKIELFFCVLFFLKNVLRKTLGVEREVVKGGSGDKSW